MKKPSWFRPIDFLSFALPGVVLIGLTIYAMIAGADAPKGGIWGCWLVAFSFVAIWGRFCWLRKKWLDEFTWYPTYGVMMHPGAGYKLPSPEYLDSTIQAIVKKWTVFFPNAESALLSDVNWCWFKKNLNETPMNPAGRKVNGFTIPGSHEFEVDYDTDTQNLVQTAFPHELGHVIMGNSTGKWDQDTHHNFMKEHGLQ
jgi:hypothetical protein